MNKAFVLPALCAIFFCISCGKTPGMPDQIGQDGAARTFTCVIASDPGSRVSISDAGKNTWEPGDQILVHGKETGSGKSATVTLKASDISADGRTATITFSGVTPYPRKEKGYTSDLYAGYPASAIPLGEKCYYYTNFNSTTIPMMAAYNEGDRFVFYNLCGVISFKVSGDFDTCEFSGNSGETVGYNYFRTYLVQQTTGKPRLDYSYSNESDGGTSGPLTTITFPVTADGSTVNYVGMPLGANFSGGFTFKFKKNGSVVKVAKTTSSANVARNKLLPLGDITAKLTDPGDEPGTEPYTGGYLCKDEYLGERPAVIAYLTEYTSSSSLDATYLTHINYCHGRFVNPKTGDGGINIEGVSLMKKVLALKTKKPSLKVLLLIGGWGEKADGFSEMAKSAAKRTEFCQACKAHIDTYGFDGIDIDWEYPGGGPSSNGQSSADKANFNLVLKELRETIGDTKIISVASSSSAGYIDWPTAIKYVDYVNDMTYDMGKPPKHNSPLHKSSTFNQSSCESSIASHKDKGIPLNRIVLGVPFYGHGIDPYASDVKYNEMAAILSATSGTYAGKNIRKWDDTAKVPYLVDESGKMYLGYDDPESVAYKGAFALEKGLFGVMFWEYRHDDSNHSLLKSLYGAVYPE